MSVLRFTAMMQGFLVAAVLGYLVDTTIGHPWERLGYLGSFLVGATVIVTLGVRRMGRQQRAAQATDQACTQH